MSWKELLCDYHSYELSRCRGRSYCVTIILICFMFLHIYCLVNVYILVFIMHYYYLLPNGIYNIFYLWMKIVCFDFEMHKYSLQNNTCIYLQLHCDRHSELYIVCNRTLCYTFSDSVDRVGVFVVKLIIWHLSDSMISLTTNRIR